MQDTAGVARSGDRDRSGRIRLLGDSLVVTAVALLHLLNPRIGPGEPDQRTSILLGALWLRVAPCIPGPERRRPRGHIRELPSGSF